MGYQIHIGPDGPNNKLGRERCVGCYFWATRCMGLFQSSLAQKLAMCMEGNRKCCSVVSFYFSPRIKLPFKSLAALSEKRLWRHLWNSAPAGGQLKFLDGQFSIQTLHTSPPLVGWSCRLIMVTVHFWFIKKKKARGKKTYSPFQNVFVIDCS